MSPIIFVAVVSQDVRIPTISRGGIINVHGIVRDKRWVYRFCGFIEAVKTDPCTQSADPAKLSQALVK